MSFETILPFIIIIGPFIIALMISIHLWKFCKWPWNEPEGDNDDWYERLTFEQRIKNAKQTYEELKATMGKEIDEILDGCEFDSIVEILNYVGKEINQIGCSMDQAVDAFNALGTPSAEIIETQKQKEPQVIFEPKTMIIETPNKKFVYPVEDKPIKIIQDGVEITHNNDEFIITKNIFDNWYDNFMEEIKQ